MKKADQRVWGWAAKAAQVWATSVPAVPASARKIKGRGYVLVTGTRLERVVRPEDPSFETSPVLEHPVLGAALLASEGASFQFPTELERTTR